MVWETQKIFGDHSIQVNPTCVRVPVFYGHSEAVHIETVDKITAEQARELLASAPGVQVMDERADGGYPTAVGDSAGTDPVFVGRIREDISHPRGLDMWVVTIWCLGMVGSPGQLTPCRGTCCAGRTLSRRRNALLVSNR